MCSINECACEAALDRLAIKRNEPSSLTLETQRICKKCRSADVEVMLSISDGGYCKRCFLTRTLHKFRATLGKSKIIRKDDSVLVFHDGSISSAALLHLIKSAQSESARKRLLMEPIVLYIDENSLAKETRRRSMESAIEQIRKLGFVGYTTSLASFSAEIIPLCAISDCNEPNLIGLDEPATFSTMIDRSAKEDLVTIQRRRTLVAAARQLGCNKILLPDTSIDVAVKLFSNLIVGRGAQLSFDADFIDARYSDVIFLRPMKDFSTEEVMHYLSFYDNSLAIKLNSLKEFNMATESATTLQATTKNFVERLDDEFSGTVSTVFRTGGKLCSEEEREKSTDARNVCILCDGNLDSGLPDTSNDDKLFAIRATDFSKLVSSTLKMNGNSDDDSTGEKMFEDIDDCLLPISAKKSSVRSICTMMCYGCRQISNNFDNCSDVPFLMSYFNK